MSDSLTVDVSVWQLRASAWELAVLSFTYPDQVLADAVLSGEWCAAAQELAAALNLELPVSFGNSLASEKCSVSELRAEATHLFIGARKPLVSPFEGVWAAHDNGVKPLMFVSPRAMKVERFVKACGLDRQKSINEPLDHIATECELLQYLAMRVSGMALEQEGVPLPDVSFPGGSPSAAYEMFVDEHVNFWFERFSDQVSAQARIPFYREAAGYLKALAAVY